MKSHFDARDQAAKSRTGCIPILLQFKMDKFYTNVKLLCWNQKKLLLSNQNSQLHPIAILIDRAPKS